MTDVFPKEERRKIMQKVKSKNTKPELIVRRFLHSKGFRFRLHVATLPGSPDLVLPKYKTAVFIQGCFWHSHAGCKSSDLPKSNIEYWTGKINRNKHRDARNQSALVELGWKVVVVWECELKKDKIEQTLSSLPKVISKIGQ